MRFALATIAAGAGRVGALVIGARMREVDRATAMEGTAGYSVSIDLSASDHIRAEIEEVGCLEVEIRT
jgi:hypothetical protein